MGEEAATTLQGPPPSQQTGGSGTNFFTDILDSLIGNSCAVGSYPVACLGV